MTFPGEFSLWNQCFDLIFRYCPVVYKKNNSYRVIQSLINVIIKREDFWKLSLIIIPWFLQRVFCTDGSKHNLITKAAFLTFSLNFTVYENIFLVAIICTLKYQYVGTMEWVEGFTDLLWNTFFRSVYAIEVSITLEFQSVQPLAVIYNQSFKWNWELGEKHYFLVKSSSCVADKGYFFLTYTQSACIRNSSLKELIILAVIAI